MDPVRDLGRIEPWQESLERSRARRAEAARRADKSSRPADERSRRAAKSSRRAAKSSRLPAKSLRPAAKSLRTGAKSLRPRAKSLRPTVKSLRPTVRPSRPWGKRQGPRARQAFTTSASGRRRNGALAARAIPRRQPRGPHRSGNRSPARPRMLLLGAGGIFAIASLLVLLPGTLASRGGHASARAANSGPPSASGHTGPDGAGPVSRWVVPRDAGLIPGCRATARPSHYVNPLARAHVKPERIDQGVDYAGSGTLAAIGAAKVTYVSTSGAGWPGAFIEYRLLDGAYAGCYVYYAEGVDPAAGLRVGQTVSAGQPIATIISGWATGIELGWGAGINTLTYAAKTHQWDATSDANSKASPAGKSFSALISSLGGPRGKVEG